MVAQQAHSRYSENAGSWRERTVLSSKWLSVWLARELGVDVTTHTWVEEMQ